MSSSLTIHGIGPKRAELLKNEAGITDAEDLLYYIPRRYADRSAFLKIADCRADETVSVRGLVVKKNIISYGKRRLEVTVDDGSGSLTGVFFGAVPWFQRLFQEGDDVIFSGRITVYGKKQIVHPDYDFLDQADDTGLSHINTGRLVPFYKSTEKLKAEHLDSRGFRKIIREALEMFSGKIADPLPEDMLRRNGLMGLEAALRAVHFPDTLQQAEEARKRLAFNELFFLIFYLTVSKNYMQAEYTAGHKKYEPSLFRKFIQGLPFSLTEDQLKAADEIRADMDSPFPMNRLLQGDVGSGKTAVALASAMFPAAAGRQTVFMAPTEVLAKQHYDTMKKLLPPDFKTAILTGGMKAEEKTQVLKSIKDGSVLIAAGTHALIQEGVEFKDLALVIIDEQHRFGVEQRSRLRKKGEKTDFLVMSATPIPRSLAMTVFGDLDISSIKSRPADRIPVKTLALPESRLRGVYNSMEKYINQGRQVFYVLPLVADSEKSDIKSAEAVYHTLSEKIFPHRKVGLLHGQMKQKDKDAVMSSFSSGETDILVATTVIEVGIDVPNAAVIVIEHPERFGLAQLHQLRGRVGRGKHQSFCVLVYPDDISPEAKKRIDIMTSVDDGFIIAEEDLKLRGTGQITGLRQHGYSEFEFADLSRDIDIISAAGKEARHAAEGITDIKKAVDDLKSGSSGSIIKGIRSRRALEILS